MEMKKYNKYNVQFSLKTVFCHKYLFEGAAVIVLSPVILQPHISLQFDTDSNDLLDLFL